MKKKLITFLLSLVCVVGLLPSQIAFAASDAEISYMYKGESVSEEVLETELKELFGNDDISYHLDDIAEFYSGDVYEWAKSFIDAELLDTINANNFNQFSETVNSYDSNYDDTVSVDALDDSNEYSEFYDALQPYYDDYYIESYIADFIVDKDNTYHITETITYDFVQPHHGPIRNIAINGERTYDDGSTAPIRSEVSNFKVSCDTASSHIASKATSSDSVEYTIGNENKTYTGEHTYTYTYDYKIWSKDPIEENDEFYFNLVGTGWDCPIDYTQISVKFPEAISEESLQSLGFSTGVEGSTGYNKEYLAANVENASDGVIEVYYFMTLAPTEGLTMRMLLPEGYFIYKDNTPIANAIFVIICILLAGIVVFLLFKRSSSVVKPVMFYPPKVDGCELDPVEVSTIYNGTGDADVVSLIPYLANLSCLTFESEERGIGIFKQTVTTFKKNPDADVSKLSNPCLEFFNGLFANSDEVSTLELEAYHFYRIIDKIKSQQSVIASKLWDGKSQSLWLITTILGGILSAVNCFIYGYFTHTGSDIGLGFFITFFGFTFTALGFNCFAPMIKQNLSIKRESTTFKSFNTINKVVTTAGKAYGTITASIGFLLFTFAGIIFYYVGSGMLTSSFLVDSVSIIFAIVICNLAKGVKCRKAETLELYGEVLGFKEFIETAEMDRLNMLLAENPNYFYDILGYAYAFGLETKWFDKFKELGHGFENCMYANITSIHDFDDFRSSMSDMSSGFSSVSASPNSGGSGSSGGSSSGGGSGGGGGGAW